MSKTPIVLGLGSGGGVRILHGSGGVGLLHDGEDNRRLHGGEGSEQEIQLGSC